MAAAKKRSDQTPEPDAVEQRVDALMDPTKPDITPSPDRTPAVAAGSPPPIDIFSDPKTAPQVPADLLKRLKSPAKSATKKVSIAVSHTSDDVLPVESVPTKSAPILSKSVKPPKVVSDEVVDPVPVTVGQAIDQSMPAEELPIEDTSDWVGPRVASQPPAVNLEDAGLDAAVADIAKHEGDDLLAAQDAAAEDAIIDPPKKKSKRRFSFGGFSGKKWWIVGLVVVVIVAVAAWPTSRYEVAGLAIHKQLTVHVVDSITGNPVTDTSLTVAGKQTTTDSAGKAMVRVPIGKKTVIASKQYYQTNSQAVTVGFGSSPSATVRLVATGRQVPITVENSITLQPLANVEVHALGTTARTDAEGKAIIVLPAKVGKDAANLSLSGYNAATTTVDVTSSQVAANDFKLTPAGHVYFLSNSSGTIDVMKANLDGTDKTTVLAGTGHENANSTQLLASADWQYLVLKASRDSSQTGLYLIDTTTGKVTEFDSSNSTFTLIGWSGDDIVYDAVKATVPASSNAHETVKSYDALHSQLNQLDASTATGTTSDYAYDSFGNFNLIANQLFYTTQWYVSGNGDDSSQSDTIRGLTVGGAAAKDYESVPTATFGYWQSAQTAPQTVSFAAYDSSDSQSTFYKLTDGAVSVDSAGSSATFNQDYPHYDLSPDTKQVFWSVLRDGQNSLFTATASGASQQTITSDGSYKAYGWYGANYLIVSENGDELLVLSAQGKGLPVKISNYYQPAGLSDVSNYETP
jgi:hypothetical protein